MNSYKILAYNKPWNMPDEIFTDRIDEDFLITNDHQYLDEAVAIVFHMPTMSAGDKMFREGSKKKGQLWVFWSMECEANYKWQHKKEILDLFDIRATYKMDADIVYAYVQPMYVNRLRKEPRPKSGFINAFISSEFNNSKRLEYLKELMDYLPVDSYGKIFNNKPLVNDDGWNAKEQIISSYKFTIAFENAIAPDYVTEKFYQPLVAGSVPVYLGAPNVDKFAPGRHCYIDTSSFSSVKVLADYLLELNANDARYQEYFEWKKLPFEEAFMYRAGKQVGDPLEELCEVIRAKWAQGALNNVLHPQI